MTPPHAVAPLPRTGRRLLAVTALAWVLTMAVLVHAEVLGRTGAADSRKLVERAGLAPLRSSAEWALRVGDGELGRFTSSLIADGRRGQRSWSFAGHLKSPLPLTLRGTALASSRGQLERLVAEVRWEGGLHRLSVLPVSGGGAPFVASWQPPEGAVARHWPLELAPFLADLPLPFPVGLFEGAAVPADRSPLTGVPTDWQVVSRTLPAGETLGFPGPTTRHEIEAGSFRLLVVTDAHGLPVDVSFPGGARLVLVEATP